MNEQLLDQYLEESYHKAIFLACTNLTTKNMFDADVGSKRTYFNNCFAKGGEAFNLLEDKMDDQLVKNLKTTSDNYKNLK